MALDKERLLELAYQLIREPGWSGGGQKPGSSAIGTVAEIFREFSCRPAKEDRLRQALSVIERLPESPLARTRSMRVQYRGIVQALGVRNGQVKHPVLKNLSFEELAYVIGWVARLHRSLTGSVTDLPEGVTPGRKSWKDPAGRQSRPENASFEKSGQPGKTSPGEKKYSDADDIDPRLAVLKNWPGFKNETTRKPKS
ncbi:hypothetical protein SAMN02745218_02172 [Desulfofundulus australicus DSM 11792]|jgi:hypothetical protein|uniref:Uncharacterized protein n=1 Tax=Desulfofundulus australicus DSM 11792 TaxID=1121425 RepID=A0A1M5BD78_9FIRM|nr:hypothetical protein [Desulfofundulus australicus]MDK2888114.1 hypothetical protein [Thermoanaerobacter sp.]SHF40366.1 hypothetical protein SAMN02745218_02172 [Desulfofundulus australicus DSM 11792]